MNGNNLIIIVKDLNNNVVKDAKVNLVSEKLSGITDDKGQIAFPLPNAKKINVEVELNGETNTTTYYLTGNSNQKLEINFASYKKLQESQSSSQTSSQSLLIKDKRQNGNAVYIFSFLIIILGSYLLFKKYQKYK
ncbi:MAG: hypothetical protein WC720_00470 [Candidatus Shapirobacteria bacterium]|jgi:hypothetical protein